MRGRQLGAPTEAQDTLIVLVGGAPPESSLPGVEISAEMQTLPRQNESEAAFTEIEKDETLIASKFAKTGEEGEAADGDQARDLLESELKKCE